MELILTIVLALITFIVLAAVFMIGHLVIDAVLTKTRPVLTGFAKRFVPDCLVDGFVLFAQISIAVALMSAMTAALDALSESVTE